MILKRIKRKNQNTKTEIKLRKKEMNAGTLSDVYQNRRIGVV